MWAFWDEVVTASQTMLARNHPEGAKLRQTLVGMTSTQSRMGGLEAEVDEFRAQLHRNQPKAPEGAAQAAVDLDEMMRVTAQRSRLVDEDAPGPDGGSAHGLAERT